MARRCVNQVELIGFVGQDPVTRHAPSGGAVASLSVGTTESWTDKTSKEKKERTEWHRCVAFDKFAEEVVGKLPKKGSYVRIVGHNRTRKYQSTKHPGVDLYTTEVVIDDMILLDPMSATDRAPADTPPPDDGQDKDIPF